MNDWLTSPPLIMLYMSQLLGKEFTKYLGEVEVNEALFKGNPKLGAVFFATSTCMG